MRSPTSAALAFALAFGLVHVQPGGAHAEGPANPSRQEVQAAAARVAQDQNLPSKSRENTLRLKNSDDESKKPDANPRMKWLEQLLRWLSETGRLLVWLSGALALALLIVGWRRWLLARAEARVPSRAAPSHVQSLDIRPESIPADIGQAAAALWQRAECRAALSLLYRGALSRLVHDHEVPIRAASTEGECLALARQSLDAGRGDFFARLVRAWQLAVYAARLPADAEAMALFREFDIHLAAQPRAGATR
ncbi:MAG: DUF4129 domain-containing protein [Ramlibacter sp.]